MGTQSSKPQPSSSARLTELERKQEQAKISELRNLLLGPERVQAERLKPYLDKVEPKDLSRALPTAIRLRNAQDQVLTDSLMPIVAAALKTAVKRDPQAVADAIFPVMAPAIRQAIATTFNQLIQSLDRSLEHSLSLKGLRWRLEAFRTGKSFAEVVLYHTLLFRVEYVFLIHRETGLLLQHVSRDGGEGKNAEIIAGMMTAIKSAWQDFMHDSFGNDPNASLSEIHVSNLAIWFEQGPQLVLACVIRGSAPEELRTNLMAPAIEAIHREQAEEIARFDGDPDPFVTTRHRLESCLQQRYEKPEGDGGFRVSPRLLIPLAVILLALVTWAFLSIRDKWRWSDYVKHLEAQPGIVITETGERNGKFFVAGLRDPMAVDPDRLLRETSMLSPSKVEGRWEAYQTLRPDFILARAKAILAPPDSVTLTLKDGVLDATGSAPREWISEARRLALAVPGVTGFRGNGVIDEEILQLKAQMENEVPRFIVGTSQFAAGQTETRDRLIADARRLFALADASSLNVRMTVVGHTDETGPAELNDRLSQERAASVKALLVAAGLDSGRMDAMGVGSREPLQANSGAPGSEINRSVTFRVALEGPAPSRKS